MYFLFKEHAHAGSYYISKKPYKKNIKEREGFCEQCYNKMLEIREMKGKADSAYEGKKLWVDYEIPYYDIQLGYQEENQTGINNLINTMGADIRTYIKMSVTTMGKSQEQVEKEIAETGKSYLGFSVTG